MTVRLPLFAALVLLTAASTASAQTAAPPGSLTILSRPTGASYRLVGEQEIVGRTPATLVRGLAGRFRVEGFRPGYERWHRTIMVDGAGADTVWMTLHRKSPALAGLRSLVVPGWGQFYTEQPARGTIYLTAAAAAGVVLALAQQRYQQRLDDYRAADERYLGASTVDAINAAFLERAAASRKVDDAYSTRQIVLGAAAGVWGLAVLDAVAWFPRPENGTWSLRLAPARDAAGRPMATLAAAVRF